MTIKVTKIAVHLIKCDLDIPFAFSQGWVKKRSATLVEIKTNEGITGWGEAFCQGLEPPEISAAVIENSLSELIIDQNPLDIELLWHKMYNQTRDFGRKGSVVAAISAIDIALWDISGKYYEKPIYQLLGGLFRKKIKPYATGFYRLNGQGEASRLAEEAIQHYENGYSINWGANLSNGKSRLINAGIYFVTNEDYVLASQMDLILEPGLRTSNTMLGIAPDSTYKIEVILTPIDWTTSTETGIPDYNNDLYNFRKNANFVSNKRH